MGRPANSRRLKIKRMMKDQNGKCYLCGEDMVVPLGEPNSATIDHVKPRFMLLDIDYRHKSNKKAACWSCNNKKSLEEHRLKCEIDAQLENPQESMNLRPVAQRSEPSPHERGVAGSNPAGPTISKEKTFAN